MVKTVFILITSLFICSVSYAQSVQEKAQLLVKDYLTSHSISNFNTNCKFGKIQALKSSYTDTKQYQNFQHKIDSLKWEGRKIDAKIPKLKTDAELDQAKKDSKQLSNQLVTVSDQLIDFMTAYKSKPVGWMVKSINNKRNKTFYLNEALTTVILVR